MQIAVVSLVFATPSAPNDVVTGKATVLIQGAVILSSPANSTFM